MHALAIAGAIFGVFYGAYVYLQIFHPAVLRGEFLKKPLQAKAPPPAPHGGRAACSPHAADRFCGRRNSRSSPGWRTASRRTRHAAPAAAAAPPRRELAGLPQAKVPKAAGSDLMPPEHVPHRASQPRAGSRVLWTCGSTRSRTQSPSNHPKAATRDRGPVSDASVGSAAAGALRAGGKPLSGGAAGRPSEHRRACSAWPRSPAVAATANRRSASTSGRSNWTRETPAAQAGLISSSGRPIHNFPRPG